jgi:hypothetical protein
VVEGVGQHVSQGYLGFAMGFSLFVELLNIRLRKKHQPIHLHQVETPAKESSVA